MHTEYLQSVRYKLQKRVRRQKSTQFQTYIPILRQLLRFLDSEPAFVAIQEELTLHHPGASLTAETIVTEGLDAADRKKLLDDAMTDERPWAAVSMEVLRRFAQMDDPRVVIKFVPPQSSTTIADHISAFSDLYLDPLLRISR